MVFFLIKNVSLLFVDDCEKIYKDSLFWEEKKTVCKEQLLTSSFFVYSAEVETNINFKPGHAVQKAVKSIKNAR